MSLVIDERFHGPPGSGNGGYTCGLVAGYLDGPAEVTLQRPPPLDRELTVEQRPGRVAVREGADVVAEAVAAEVEVVVPEPIDFDSAERAVSSYAGFARHPCPGCFVCGPDRRPGDGLRIFAGEVPEGQVFASSWVPDSALLRPEFVWAALDCPGGFAAGYPETTLLLGRLAARIDRLPEAGERCVAMGWQLGVDGRKHFAGTALVSGREVLARGRATWIAPKAD
jgi:hypothetical protein